MAKSATNAEERLPDLTSEEVAAVMEWARRAKAGEPHLLWPCPETDVVTAKPMGETQRPDQNPQRTS